MERKIFKRGAARKGSQQKTKSLFFLPPYVCRKSRCQISIKIPSIPNSSPSRLLENAGPSSPVSIFRHGFIRAGNAARGEKKRKEDSVTDVECRDLWLFRDQTDERICSLELRPNATYAKRCYASQTISSRLLIYETR